MENFRSFHRLASNRESFPVNFFFVIIRCFKLLYNRKSFPTNNNKIMQPWNFSSANDLHYTVWTPVTDKMHKCIMWEDGNKWDAYAVNDQLQQSLKRGCTYQEICQEYAHFLMHGSAWHYLNNFCIRHLNGSMCLFYSFCCTTQRIYPLRVYEPSFNTDKYNT